MSKLERIVFHEIREISGKPALVYKGESGAEMYLPASGMESLFQDAFRKLSAWAAQKGGSAAQWRAAMINTPQTWSTGLTDAGSVAIIVDRGLPSEQTFALTGDHADALGKQLIEAAPQALGPANSN